MRTAIITGKKLARALLETASQSAVNFENFYTADDFMKKGAGRPECQELVILCSTWQDEEMADLLAWISEHKQVKKWMVCTDVSLPMVLAAAALKDDVDTMEELEKSLLAEVQGNIHSLIFEGEK